MPIKLLLVLLATIIFPAFAHSQMAAPHGPCHYFETDFPWIVNLNGCECYSMDNRACPQPPIPIGEAYCYNYRVGEEGRFYCAGGTVRQCDKELTSQSEGPDGPYASECDVSEYCSQNGRCDTCKTSKSCNDQKFETTDVCVEGTLYERKQTCGHCEVIKGRAGAVTQVTFVAGNEVSELELRELLLAVGELEPFQTLIKWGNLNFQIASGNKSYSIIPYASNFSVMDLSHDFRQSVLTFGSAVCENSDFTVYVISMPQVYADPKAGGAYYRGENFIIVGGYIVGMGHELGHALGNLADEYPTDKEFQMQGANVIEGVEGRFCPQFDRLVKAPNCFYIDKDNYPARRKSRCSSIMDGDDEARFNIVSCASIMKEVAKMSMEHGVEFCTGLAQTGKVLAQDCF